MKSSLIDVIIYLCLIYAVKSSIEFKIVDALNASTSQLKEVKKQ